MKTLIRYVLLLAVVLLFPAAVSANSGPVYWQGYPSSEIMAVEENSPLMVNEENLVFDFSGADHSGHSISGKVTATYEMLNPTNETRTVKMAFPFVGSLERLSPESIVITANDRAIPYDIYVGDVVNSHGNPRQEEKEAGFDFAGIVNTITNELYQAENFEEDEKGKLYTIDVQPTTAQRINFAVDFSFNYEKTKVLANGFNRYERDGDKTRIAAWCREPVTLEIYVLGEDIDFTVNAYTDGELKKKTGLFNYEISTQEIELKPYLRGFVKKNGHGENDGMISETQLYNVYAKSLDNCFTQNMGFGSEHDILAQEYYERVLALLYTVEFPSNREKRVSVSYTTSGTMDRTKTGKPLYSFDYILNPAKNWSAFKNLNITIIAPEAAPYVVQSSVELTKGENRTYTAALPSLPADDLSFTLYEEEKITLYDKTAGKLLNTFGYFTPLLFSPGLFLIIVIIVIILRNRLARW